MRQNNSIEIQRKNLDLQTNIFCLSIFFFKPKKDNKHSDKNEFSYKQSYILKSGPLNEEWQIKHDLEEKGKLV